MIVKVCYHVYMKKHIPRWKNITKGKYDYLHRWVGKHFGKPDICEKCGKSGLSGQKIQWSNVSGKYTREREDWERLCTSCHKKKDVTDWFREDRRKKMLGNTFNQKPVVGFCIVTKETRRWQTIAQAADELGILRTSISNNLSGRSGSAGGYIWEYA